MKAASKLFSLASVGLEGEQVMIYYFPTVIRCNWDTRRGRSWMLSDCLKVLCFCEWTKIYTNWARKSSKSKFPTGACGYDVEGILNGLPNANLKRKLVYLNSIPSDLDCSEEPLLEPAPSSPLFCIAPCPRCCNGYLCTASSTGLDGEDHRCLPKRSPSPPVGNTSDESGQHGTTGSEKGDLNSEFNLERLCERLEADFSCSFTPTHSNNSDILSNDCQDIDGCSQDMTQQSVQEGLSSNENLCIQCYSWPEVQNLKGVRHMAKFLYCCI